MNEEIGAFEKNRTWETSDFPNGKKPVGCKWVSTVNRKVDGSVNKLNIIAKGFYSILWHKLSGDVHSSCQTQHDQCPTLVCS